MKYNVCLIQPEGYVHSGAFLELAELLYFGIAELGVETTGGINHVEPDARNIIIGCHLLDPSLASGLPASTIILNTEQLQDDEILDRDSARTEMENNILLWLSRFEAWDYSQRNIDVMARRGVTGAKLLELGYHPRLARIDRAAVQDIDVLFYGSISERRRKILMEIEARGLRVKHLFGVYGAARDEMIARTKVVLNLHIYPTQIFEVVRVFYLMINSKATAGEVSEGTSIPDNYRHGIYTAPYDGLVDACERLVADNDLRRGLEQRAQQCIKLMPQPAIMQRLLAS